MQLLHDVDIPTIIHGEPFKDRKSIFQAHLAPVTSETQVEPINKLLKKGQNCYLRSPMTDQPNSK